MGSNDKVQKISILVSVGDLAGGIRRETFTGFANTEKNRY